MKIKRKKLEEVRDVLDEAFLTPRGSVTVRPDVPTSCDEYIIPWNSDLGRRLCALLNEIDYMLVAL